MVQSSPRQLVVTKSSSGEESTSNSVHVRPSHVQHAELQKCNANELVIEPVLMRSI